jgi:thiol-disulfide isomerase/thioredoxin
MRRNYVQPNYYEDRRWTQPNYRQDTGDGQQQQRQQQRQELGYERSGYEQPKPYDKVKYQGTVDRTFGTDHHQVKTKDDYRESLFKAAEEKKPVVMMFGRGSDPNCQSHLESLERAKQQAGGKAEFVFVDLDKVDKNSAIGKYAWEHIRSDFGTPLTMVFNQKQGEGNKPVQPERPTHWQRGPLNEQSLLQGIDQAERIQKEREIKTGRERQNERKDPYSDYGETRRDGTDNAQPPKPSEAEQLTQKLMAESIKPWNQQKPDELFKGMDQQAKLKACWDAIAHADKQNNPQLSAQVRAMVAFASIGWGAEAEKAGDKELADKHYLRGCEYLISAGVHNGDLYKYPGFADHLRNSQLPGNAADFILDKGAANPKWFYPTPNEISADANAYQKKRDEYTSQFKAEMAKPKVRRKAA